MDHIVGLSEGVTDLARRDAGDHQHAVLGRDLQADDRLLAVDGHHGRTIPFVEFNKAAGDVGARAFLRTAWQAGVRGRLRDVFSARRIIRRDDDDGRFFVVDTWIDFFEFRRREFESRRRQQIADADAGADIAHGDGEIAA